MISLWFLGTVALAQDVEVPELNAQLYRPPMDARHTLWADSAGDIVDGFAASPRFTLQYLNRPLRYTVDQTDERFFLVSDVLQLNVVLAASYDRFRFGVDIPVYLFQAGQLTTDGPGIGDVALDARVTLLDADDAPVGVGAGVRIDTPTATVESALGAPGVGAEFYAAGTVRPTEKLTINANIGTRVDPQNELENVDLNDAFLFRAGGAYLLAERAGLSLDFNGRASYSVPLSNAAGSPIEGVLGGFFPVDDWVARLGVGTGLTPGIGSPVARVLASVNYIPAGVKDTDLDGIMDPVDQCIAEPEDIDGFEDQDGCPDPDNDGDGILDQADRCPNDPEDEDGYRDMDGCSDPSYDVPIVVQDPDGEVITTANISVPTEPEPVLARAEAVVQLHPGDYVVSATAPGFLPGEAELTVAETNDQLVLVLEPEALVGTLKVVVLDEEGAAVPNATWTVDDQPGVDLVDGMATAVLGEGEHMIAVMAEGFLPAADAVAVVKDQLTEHMVILRRPRVKVTRTRIDIEGTVYFETAKATIKSESFDLLDEVAQTLIDHPEILEVRIEGHTDARGGADYNRKLSDRRAASVLEYMVEKGVARDRLSSIGYGEDRPVDPRNVPEAWEKNRRVDFFIEKREGESEDDGEE